MLRNPVTMLDFGISSIRCDRWNVTAGLVKDTTGKRNCKRGDAQKHNQLATRDDVKITQPPFP